MNKVHGDKLKRHCRDDRLKWSINMDSGFALFQALAYSCNFCPHKLPIEMLSSQLDYSVLPLSDPYSHAVVCTPSYGTSLAKLSDSWLRIYDREFHLQKDTVCSTHVKAVVQPLSLVVFLGKKDAV